MDKELLEALGKILDEKLMPIKNEIEKLTPIKNEVQKNSILLEDLNKKVDAVAEVQSAIREQLERAKDKDGHTLADRLDIIELSVKDTSSRVKDIQRDITRVVRETAENWAEIVELKSVK